MPRRPSSNRGIWIFICEDCHTQTVHVDSLHGLSRDEAKAEAKAKGWKIGNQHFRTLCPLCKQLKAPK